MIKLSWTPKPRYVLLEKRVRELESRSGNTDVTRADIIFRAIQSTKDFGTEDWEKVYEGLGGLPKTCDDLTIPTAMQITVPDTEIKETLIYTETKIKRALGLTNLHTQFAVQLYLFACIQQLEKKLLSTGDREDNEQNELTGPDMVKKLVQILLLNREEDKELVNELKTILKNWKE